MYLSPDDVDAFRQVEQELSRIEYDIGSLAFEPFPEHPGAGASNEELRAWLVAHDLRTERLIRLMEHRRDAIRSLKEKLLERL